MGSAGGRKLGLAPGLRVRLDAAGHVRVDTALSGIVDAGPDGLAILSLFGYPRTVDEAIGALDSLPEPRPDRAASESVISSLIETGALVNEGVSRVRFGWADPGEHARMLDDTRRTDAFVAAIRESVRPGDIVLDIGTGSGILAITAAQAGAAHVYAIEASDIAGLAARAFEDNGVADRVTLVRGWSTQVELPERATLLVSEIIGAEPLEEDILGTTLDARRRLLTPDARLIPRRISLVARAVTVPQPRRWASRVDAASVRNWRERYGVDLSVLWEARRRVPLPSTAEGMLVSAWPVLGPSITLTEIDLSTLEVDQLEAVADVTIDRPGVVDAILLTFSAELSDGVVLEGPPWSDAPSSWDTSVWFLPDALPVDAGVRLRVSYRFGVPGSVDGLSCRRLEDRSSA